MFGTQEEARVHAVEMAERTGSPTCVVSGRKKGMTIYRVYPLKGFGLPAGGTLVEVLEPETKRVELEPKEKTSTNGF